MEYEVVTHFNTLPQLATPIETRLFGVKEYKKIVFKDTYFAFKQALCQFIDIIQKRRENDTKRSTIQSIRIIEKVKNELTID